MNKNQAAMNMMKLMKNWGEMGTIDMPNSVSLLVQVLKETDIHTVHEKDGKGAVSNCASSLIETPLKIDKEAVHEKDGRDEALNCESLTIVTYL